MSKTRKSKLLVREKWTISNGLVREITVWDVPVSKLNPEGIRYRMVLVDSLSGEILVLFDNHSPKGHHMHLAGKESPYNFEGLSKLIADFLDLSRKWEG